MSDPINPAHYDGTACAQIGERLTGNSYQVLKYNWRLGKKDDPVIEVGKSIWYLDREILIAKGGFKPYVHTLSDIYTHELLAGVSPFVEAVVWKLYAWNRAPNNFDALTELRFRLVTERARLEQLATGQGSMAI